jgi:hypothetical protein
MYQAALNIGHSVTVIADQQNPVATHILADVYKHLSASGVYAVVYQLTQSLSECVTGIPSLIYKSTHPWPAINHSIAPILSEHC